MIFPADKFTFAHIVDKIFQLILRINVVRQNRFLQRLKERPADNGIFEVNIVSESFFIDIERDKADIVEGIKADRKLFKGQEVLPEQIGILRQQPAVLCV